MEMKKCPYCKVLIRKAVEKCKYCGTTVMNKWGIPISYYDNILEGGNKK